MRAVAIGMSNVVPVRIMGGPAVGQLDRGFARLECGVGSIGLMAAGI